ncbi:MAG: S1 RNA-binding domain-containing protein, partial [Thermaurantiacus sp.]
GVSGEAALSLFKKGDSVSARVLEVDVERERISLGIKQAQEGAGAGGGAGAGAAARNEVVTCTVVEVKDGGIEVQIGEDGPTAFIKRSDLSRDRDEQRPERFQPGQKVDAVVTGFDRSKRPNLSIKALQIAEEKQRVAQYGSSDSGASLGDILGAALNKAKDQG